MDILKCPTCGKPLKKQEKSYICAQGHCYDIARSGYVNLLPPNRKRTLFPGDNADMIAARVALMDSGYYDALGECVCKILQDKSTATVLDIGCGEGYISRIIKLRYPKTHIMGIDISKFAVDAASKRCKDNLYCVASSAALPVCSGSIDVIINTFAPIDTGELDRVLTKDGILIKIVPAPQHLWHLKELLYENPYQNPEDTFSPQGYTLKQKIVVESMFETKGKQIESLLQMTPYYYKTAKESLDRIIALPSLITKLSFCVMVFCKDTNL